MPVRRRRSKRNDAGLETWAVYLETGHDFFGDLVDAGIIEHDHAHPKPEEARAAWERFAPFLIRKWGAERHPDQGEAWAIEKFGLPCRRKRRTV